ncbi:MAG: N-acetylmuramoyl-L-alanine amidase [Treponema sp.]|jgi:N-acetylmuramoyl-L-alanine amidase|nr:N-acetylmuramoyl-L-alanine amidase [Treponema sp.]
MLKNTARLRLLIVLLFLSSPGFAQTPGTAISAAVSSPATGQNAAAPQTLTLDETIAALKSAGKAGEAPPELRWDPFFQSGVFSFGGHNGTFSSAASAGKTGFLMFDGREVFTVPLPYQDKGELVFPQAFALTLKDAFTRYFEEDSDRFRIAAIIIDPGHGGKDPGAIGSPVVNGKPLRVVEKDIVLNVSKQLKNLLVRAYPDKQILMTRDSDVFYTLEERTSMANSVPLKENEAIIYISIHANYVFNPRTRGYEVWYLSPDYRRTVLDRSKYPDSAGVAPILNAMLEEEFTTESIIIAQSILKAFEQTLGASIPSRGLKAEEWFVVRNSRMPAVLVELGFVSNPEDAQLMTSEGGLQKLTEALYKGITDFVSVFERSGGFTAVH